MRWFYSEIIGTFLLVLFGCGSVAVAISTGALVGIMQIALVWGLGLAIAIHITGPISGAHLNPAITLAFATTGSLSWKRVPGYILAQFIGAFIAALALFILFNDSITAMENSAGIERGETASVASAKIFGEYFLDPITHKTAFLAEALGTGLLAFAIFGFIHPRNKSVPKALTPLLIGFTLSVLISLLAPLSQGGFNPARDFAPRIVSTFTGWGDLPFTYNGISWLTVYIIAPFIGAQVGAFSANALFRSEATDD